MTRYAVIGAVPAVFAAAVTLLSISALAQGRTYAEPYPYQKSDPAKGYTLYQLHGCGDYELLPPARVRQ